MLRICFFSILLLSSCASSHKTEQSYIHIDGRDTSRLRLVRYEDTFYGELIHTKGGVAPVIGKINGDINGDILLGDNHYKPYRWKENKRVPIVLMKQGDNYIEGSGKMIELMGILTYINETISFDNPKRIYKPVNKDNR